MRRWLFVFVLLGAAPLSAHHGFGDYDGTRLVTLTGSIEQFSYQDPHSSVRLLVGATPGRGTLKVDTAADPKDAFALVIVTHAASGRTLRYTIDAEVRELLDGWKKLPPGERLAALRTVPVAELYTRTASTR